MLQIYNYWLFTITIIWFLQLLRVFYSNSFTFAFLDYSCHLHRQSFGPEQPAV